MLFVEGKVSQMLKECDLPQQHPIDGLLEVVRHSGAMMRMLAGLVGELDTTPGSTLRGVTDTGEPLLTPSGIWGYDHNNDQASNVLVLLYERWADRYAKACKLALDADIDERLVRNAESTTEGLFTALTKALGKVELSEQQRSQLRTELAKQLRAMTGLGEEVQRELTG